MEENGRRSHWFLKTLLIVGLVLLAVYLIRNKDLVKSKFASWTKDHDQEIVAEQPTATSPSYEWETLQGQVNDLRNEVERLKDESQQLKNEIQQLKNGQQTTNSKPIPVQKNGARKTTGPNDSGCYPTYYTCSRTTINVSYTATFWYFRSQCHHVGELYA